MNKTKIKDSIHIQSLVKQTNCIDNGKPKIKKLNLDLILHGIKKHLYFYKNYSIFFISDVKCIG